MWKRNKLFVILLWGNYWVCCVFGHAVDLYTAKDRHGNSIRIDVSDRDCTNFPVAWNGRVVSVDTMGNCMQFYEDTFCRGSLTVLQPFHTIHQMDLSLINFANVIQSASPCGPKVSEGRYVLQNAADASILTVENRRGGFSSVLTKPPVKVIEKTQQWDIVENSLSEYTLKPREHEDNYPVTFDETALKNGKIVRKRWRFSSVGRGRYVIKSVASQKCLYKTDEQKVEENTCRVFSPNQEWVLRPILTPNPGKPSKATVPVGPGLNLNILSKVSQYRPNRFPKPDLIPIYLNSSIAHTLTRPSLVSPYQIRKKIKRGPRPQSQMQDLAVGLRPPGVRPALPSRIANNNDFLLLKLPASQAAKRPIVIPHTVPKDSDEEDEDEDKSAEEEVSEEKEADEEDEEDNDEENSSSVSTNGKITDNNSRESRWRPVLNTSSKFSSLMKSINILRGKNKKQSNINKVNTPLYRSSIGQSEKKKNSNHEGNTNTRSKADLSSEETDSSEGPGFMQLFFQGVKSKMTSVGSRWHKKKLQQRRKQQLQQQKHNNKKQPKTKPKLRDSFEAFLDNI